MKSVPDRPLQLTAWRVPTRLVVAAMALVFLLGALITPWGLAQSHGLAAVSTFHHGDSGDLLDEGGHSHEDDATVSQGVQVHHAGDHSHDHAHAVPTGLPVLSGSKTAWHAKPAPPGPWPSLDDIEHPPRG